MSGSVTRAPLDLIRANHKGNVIAEGGRLSVEQSTGITETEFTGNYDPSMGTLTLTIPGYEKIAINGFLTASSVTRQSSNVPSVKSRDGIDGTIGLDGRTGDQGCQGPQGPRGITGARGPRGFEGQKGATGQTGEQGDRGNDGRVLVFVQQEDPGPVGAFAFWLLPT